MLYMTSWDVQQSLEQGEGFKTWILENSQELTDVTLEELTEDNLMETGAS